MAIAAVAMALVAAMAYTLVAGQNRADSLILQRYGERAKLAAGFTASVLATSAKQNIDAFRKQLSGSPAAVKRGLREYVAGDPSGSAAVLDERGRVIASAPDEGLLRSVAEGTAERRALRGRVSLSDVFVQRGTPVVDFDIPFSVRGHRRVLMTTVALAQLEQFVAGYLKSAPAVAGARAYLLDGQGRVIVSTAGDKPTSVPAERSVRALADAKGATSGGGRRYVSRPVTHTRWCIVFSAPERELFAPVRGATRRSEWILFAFFVVILMGFVAAGVSTLRRSEQLSVARTREENALERERTARQLAHERLHDPLTGLPNRALFLDRIAHALSGVGRRGRPLMVMFIDLDRFKRVNDSLGHSQGDQVVREVARRLGTALRPTDTVGRFGGDEFLVLCESIADEREAIRIATRVTEAIEAPMRVGERDLHVTACIGIALQSPAAKPVDGEALIRDADAAMYRAKEQGPASVKVFDPEVHRLAVERLEMEIALREAIARNEMVVHYQPIVSLEDWSLKGVEALVRWNRPGIGLVPPLEFIPLAEERG
jgi:diguanylate cyclase (GGDEF)-like protein